jgi:hypothetical protein
MTAEKGREGALARVYCEREGTVENLEDLVVFEDSDSLVASPVGEDGAEAQVLLPGQAR